MDSLERENVFHLLCSSHRALFYRREILIFCAFIFYQLENNKQPLKLKTQLWCTPMDAAGTHHGHCKDTVYRQKWGVGHYKWKCCRYWSVQCHHHNHCHCCQIDLGLVDEFYMYILSSLSLHSPFGSIVAAKYLNYHSAVLKLHYAFCCFFPHWSTSRLSWGLFSSILVYCLIYLSWNLLVLIWFTNNRHHWASSWYQSDKLVINNVWSLKRTYAHQQDAYA